MQRRLDVERPHKEHIMTNEEYYRYLYTSKEMGFIFCDIPDFVTRSIEWLSTMYGDLHMEYHEEVGWQITSCYLDGSWGESGWVSGDGSLRSALLVMAEGTITRKEENINEST